MRARFEPLHKLTGADREQMYSLFERYYLHSDRATFQEDLQKKSGAIVVRRKTDGVIVGFSTIVSMPLNSQIHKARGIFSGDTVLEKEYWGDKSLNRAFFAHVVREKLRRPFQPLYWLLISKGYKTYLLLANNFQRYYPHPEGQHPELEPLVRRYSDWMFGENYDPQRGLLDFGERAQRLRASVAPIDDGLRRREPKIHYFERLNPSWEQGTELPCVGHVNLVGILHYLGKSLRQLWCRSKTGAPG